MGPDLAKKLATVNVQTVGDLIGYFPRRYDDYSNVLPIKNIKPGPVTIKAVIKQATGRYVRRGMHITEAAASDDTSSVRIIWFNQPYRAAAIKKDQEYFISGTFELSHQHLQIMNPSVELVSEFPVNTARIVPIYRETKGLTSRQIRKALQQVVPLTRQLPETLPVWLVEQEKLLSYATAVEMIHFPTSSEKLQQAKKRLGFEEVFGLSLASLLTKNELQLETAPSVAYNKELAANFASHLPFKLTDAQRKSIHQIYLDMEKTSPMNRLVEGDVGSGKTAVAAMAALMVMQSGHQVALMAPTEILARQHADTLQKLLRPLGLDKKVGLLVGSQKPAEKKRVLAHIKNGDMQFIVGTHALIQDKVDLKNLELIIIDEQHRFGVEQRKELMRKAGHMPHVLSLTATPIPRSLALTLFGELDVSILDEKPPGRQPVQTKIISPNSRTQLYEKIKQELDAGRQMFVVCPLIAESTTVSANSAEKVYETLSKKDFKNYQVGLLHGKMKADQKSQVMQDFIDKKVDILVSTTVIEVGVDVPNASVMLIEAPERFGLAQIHQLRGRVGRGGQQAYCYLLMSDSKATSRRLRALESSGDGFKLAELDLEIRGPGAIYGQLQHGQLDLRIAQLTDIKLIVSAKKAAQAFLDKNENLVKYKVLYDHVNNLMAVTNLN